MYRDIISNDHFTFLTNEEFHALEGLIHERLEKSTPLKPIEISTGDINTEALSLKVESPPSPSLDDILVTDLCDRIKELESWREGVDSGQSPTANILSLQNRVTSIEQQLTDLSATVTQHKAEQDNLDKIASPRHNKAHISTLRNRLAGLAEAVALDKKDRSSRQGDIEERLTYVIERITALEETLRPIKEEYDRYSFHDNTNVYARLNSMDKRIRNLASQTEGDE